MKNNFTENGITYFEGDKIRSIYSSEITGTIMYGKFHTGFFDKYGDLQYGFYIKYDDSNLDCSIYGFNDEIWFEKDITVPKYIVTVDDESYTEKQLRAIIEKAWMYDNLDR